MLLVSSVELPEECLSIVRVSWCGLLQHEAAGALTRVRAEQAHAARVAAQLRALLAELAALRAQVRRDHLPRFDALTQRSRDLTLRAIVDYLGNCPPAFPTGAAF